MFDGSQNPDQCPGWYILDETEPSSTESESASINVVIRQGSSLLRRIRRKRKTQEANADETKIADVVRQMVLEIVELIGKA